MDRKSPLPILMVSTALDQVGGVAAVLRTWREEGLFERCQVRHVATNGGWSGWGGRSGLAKVASAIRAWCLCAAWILPRRVRLVHVHTSSYVSFWRKAPVMAMALLGGVPLVMSLHGGAFARFYEELPPTRRAWVRWFMRRSSRFVVLTPGWARWALAIEPLAKVEVIPNTVVMPPMVAASSAPPAADGPSLLFLGRLEALKGIDTLLKALVQVHGQGAGWRLVLAGPGDAAAVQEEWQRLGGAAGAIQCAGTLDAAGKQAALQRCSLLVLPSRVENMPVVVLEAWAAARPVMVTSVGGLPDMVAHGRDGWLTPPGDADALAVLLVQAWHERDRLAAMGTSGREKAERLYAPSVVLAQVQMLYNTCGRPRGFSA